jgi:hypothetical protein
MLDHLLNDNFPIYKVKNFYIPFFNKKSMINTVVDNKKYFNPNIGNNYPIKDDPTSSFKKLYKKFFKLCEKKFLFTTHPRSSNMCWAYLSDENNFKEEWHNHLHSSTINSVYYLNIPKNNGSITFELNKNFLEQKVNNYDLLIFPNYLNHKPNRSYCKNLHRISINMEIICNENSENVFNSVR